MENFSEEAEIEVIPLQYGVAFKKAFRQVDIFCEFVKDVTGVELKIDKVFEEYQYPQIGNVHIRYDLFAEDIEHQIIVEIQHVMETEHYDRLLYYHLAGIMEQVSKSEDYEPNREVYTIIVLTGSSTHQTIKDGVARIKFNPIAEDAEEPNAVIPLEKNHQLIFLNPRMANARTAPNIKRWLDLIADSLDEKVKPTQHITAMLQKVIREIQKDTISPQENAQLKFEKEMQKSIQQGIQLGIQLGRQEGIQQGSQATKIEVTQNMLKRGMDIATVAELTGLSNDEVSKLIQ